jgi:hypothetical protein
MMIRPRLPVLLLVLGTIAALAGCGPSADNPPANQAAAAPPQPKVPYCFFKDSETKGWSASRDKDGNIVVKGKAFREDSRYKALLGPPAVSGTSVEVRPTITVNDTGFGAPENWWSIEATIPDSAAIDSVNVRCGAKTLAELKVPVKG